MDVLMMIGIVIAYMSTSKWIFNMRYDMIFLDRKYVALSMAEVEYDVIGMAHCKAGWRRSLEIYLSRFWIW